MFFVAKKIQAECEAAFVTTGLGSDFIAPRK
jgi:hypothetical protein